MSDMASKERILLVDDHPLNVKLLQATLSSEYFVLSATNGMGALDIANSADPPDLILLDIMMPGLNGYEVCERLKSSERTRRIPVIFLTARKEEEAESRGFVVGGVDYIVKPFHPNLVKARVRTHLDLKRHRDRLEELVHLRTAELQKSNEELQAEIEERRRFQAALQKATDELERRVQERTEALSTSNALLQQEIVERKRSEEALKESQAYLGAVMATMQTAMIVINSETRKVVDANPFATKLIGCRLDRLKGQDWDGYLYPEASACGHAERPARNVIDTDCILRSTNDHPVYVRRTAADLKIRNRVYTVESLADVTDIKNLLKEQEIDIGLAKKILRMANGDPPRHIPLSEDLVLFVDAVSIPCNKEGGDHFFVRNLSGNGSAGKTVMSLKDQSGHKVGCILRSIITDLLHNAMLAPHGGSVLEDTITRLNQTICRAGLFESDDFFTSMNVEIDHETLKLRYVSTGHPPFLLIRGGAIITLPDGEGVGNNIPIPVTDRAVFSAGEYQLREGDKWIFYTDGLIEMPQKKRKKTLSAEELKAVTAQLISRDGCSSVSDIALGLLEAVSEMSGEEVSPGSVNNTSNDDITLVWMEIERRSHCLEEVCRPNDTDDACDCVDRLMNRLSAGLRPTEVPSLESRIRPVLEEAIMNAWIHGNRKDPDKNITVRWRWGNDVHLEVIDEGDGFDYESIPDPRLSENVAKTSGRGIFVMRFFADAVSWEDRGRHVVASFRMRPRALAGDGMAMDSNEGGIS